MKVELAGFDVTPRILPVGRESEITIRPLHSHTRLDYPGAQYRVSMLPAGGSPGHTNWQDPAVIAPEWLAGGLRLRYTFPSEQEYILYVEDLSDSKRPRSFEFRFYALEPDLYARRFYKGDLHMHSTRSDGREDPAYVAGACRRIGLDFAALTDHRQYEPSLEAMRAYAGLPIDLRLYPGEEVHPPDNPVHIVNFGAAFSLNAIFREDEARYRAEVQVIADGLADFPAGLDRYTYASCAWCYQQIRAGGGLGIFCHPYWFNRRRYDVPEALTDLVFHYQPFDAVEVVGGYYRHEFESNSLQVARYHEQRARGRKLGAVGVSDAHGVERGELFGWYFTLVFSPSLELADLVESIRGEYSVAVETIPNEVPRAYGPFRLVRYAMFLLREVLPLHDALCEEEGRLMIAHAAGDSQAAAGLAALQGRTAALYARIHPI